MYRLASISNTSALSPSVSVLFLLHLIKRCNSKSVACIASVVQQLLQTSLVVLIDIYFEVMRTLIALAMTILYMPYTVTCVYPITVVLF